MHLQIMLVHRRGGIDEVYLFSWKLLPRPPSSFFNISEVFGIRYWNLSSCVIDSTIKALVVLFISVIVLVLVLMLRQHYPNLKIPNVQNAEYRDMKRAGCCCQLPMLYICHHACTVILFSWHLKTMDRGGDLVVASIPSPPTPKTDMSKGLEGTAREQQEYEMWSDLWPPLAPFAFAICTNHILRLL